PSPQTSFIMSDSQFRGATQSASRKASTLPLACRAPKLRKAEMETPFLHKTRRLIRLLKDSANATVSSDEPLSTTITSNRATGKSSFAIASRQCSITLASFSAGITIETSNSSVGPVLPEAAGAVYSISVIDSQSRHLAQTSVPQKRGFA